MLAYKHSDYCNEKENLKSACEGIDNAVVELQVEMDSFTDQKNKLMKTFSGGFSNEFEIISNILDMNTKKIKELERAKNKPYFGRIDFTQLGWDKDETFYIGKTSVVRKKDDKRLVIDWRAPIAGLYYSGEIGEVMYKAPEGLIMGDLILKRQYEIEGRKLINIFDKGLTPMDEFLQNALWQKKDNRLRDIVTTIQGEQNDIIRADKGNVVIVQGVAGSGKTTIVLHRIAYLMYTYKDILRPENILVIVPNNLFLNYISDVLPDLGVEEITQATFEDFAIKLLGEDYRLTGTEDKLLKLLDFEGISHEERDNIKFASVFKGSYLLKGIIDSILEDIINDFIPNVDFEISGYKIYTYNDVKRMFYQDYSYLQLFPRVEKIKKYFKATLKNKIKDIKDGIEEKYDELVNKAKKKISDDEELRKNLIKIYDERDKILNSIDKDSTLAVENYFKSWPQISIEGLYKDLITNTNLLAKYCNHRIDSKKIDFVTRYSRSIFDKGYFEREDLAPLLYIKNRLMALNSKKSFGHIVVDEAQDYSPMQMVILKELSSNNSFTIVGDLSQGIHSYRGINDWDEIMKDVFSNRKIEYLTIKKCYRSTMEIMNFANEVIKKLNKQDITLAEPVLRNGDKPFIIKKDHNEDMLRDIETKIDDLKKDGHKSIAIICKTSKECEEVYRTFEEWNHRDIQLITSKDTEYHGGIVIIPSYLAKGLEFDAVIIYDCSKDSYLNNELHIKLFYVATTRALHKLYIYYRKEPSALIKGISKEFYN
ncbi:RNA polymerase recycling motor HelD [Wukongibacter baidiensis]|uniref:RNA polymerase recycling motor HelD n=1 Tax=Wukongibacter baidiensis TaxID=1723361 RepID=UPI003D7FE41A